MFNLSKIQSCEKVFDKENSGFLTFFSTFRNFPRLQDRLVYLSDITGYYCEQINGQRIYRIQDETIDLTKSDQCEVYFSGLPSDVFEDDLVLVFGKICRLKQIRTMMNYSGNTRGFGFVTFFDKQCAQRAVELLNGFEIRPGFKMSVSISFDCKRLYVGNINKCLTEKEIQKVVTDFIPGLVKVILYNDRNKLNRGYGFLDFESHLSAIHAKRCLREIMVEKLNCSQCTTVSWAFRENVDYKEIDCKVLFIRGLPSSTTQNILHKYISQITGSYNVKEIKIIRNFAFVTFYSRTIAEFVKKKLEVPGVTIQGGEIEVAFSRLRRAGPLTYDLPLKNMNISEKFHLTHKFWNDPKLEWVYSRKMKFYVTVNKFKQDLSTILFCLPGRLYSFCPSQPLIHYLGYPIPEATEVLEFFPYLKRCVKFQNPNEIFLDFKCAREVLMDLKKEIICLQKQLKTKCNLFKPGGSMVNLQF